MKRSIWLFALLSSLICAEEKYSLDEIHVSGSGGLDVFDFSLENQTRSVSILKQEDLMKYSGTGSIQSVLENVPGILYSRSGGANGQITMRGMNSISTRSIITIDGVRFDGRKALDFNMIDPGSVDSVEIIRGPASSLYGSNAMNGVINFRSRRYKGDINKPFDMDFRVRSLGYSSVNNAFSSRFEALGGGNGFDVLLGIFTRNAGNFRTPEGRALNSGYDSFGVDTNVGYTNSDGTRYYLQGRFTRMHSRRAGGMMTAPGSSYGIFTSEDPIMEYYLRMGLEGENLSFADSYNAYIYWRHWDTDILDDRRCFVKNPKTGVCMGPYIIQKVYNNNYLGSRILFNTNLEKHLLTYGVESSHAISPQRVRLTRYDGSLVGYPIRAFFRHTLSAFVKDDYTFNDSLLLSASLRADYTFRSIGKKRSLFETPEDNLKLNNARNSHEQAITGALGAVYHFNEFFSIFGNLSHNFRAPDAYEIMPSVIGGNTRELIRANPDLKPEYSQTLELGTRFESQDSYVALSAFYTRYTNMINLTASLPMQFPSGATRNGIGGAGAQGAVSQQISSYRNRINIGKATISGIEFEAKHKIGALSLGANLSATYGQDNTNHRPLAYIAPLYGKIDLSYNLPWGFVGLTQRAYMGKHRINALEERKTKSYTMSDLYLGLDLGYFNKEMKNMELLFGIDNVFDVKGMNPVTAENIRYARSLTNPLLEPGRNFFLRFGYKY